MASPHPIQLLGPKKTVVVELRPGIDPTLNPRFLGERPVEDPDGTCSFCGDPFGEHWDQDTEQYLDGDEWHRRDYIGGDGFYSDEIPAVTR